MPLYIKLTADTGTPLWINRAAIVVVSPVDPDDPEEAATVIELSNDTSLFVREAPEAVMAALDPLAR